MNMPRQRLHFVAKRTKRSTKFACVQALFAAAATTSAFGASPLLVDLKNLSGLPDSQVYIGFIGGTLVATNLATNTSLSESTYSNPSWYTLNQLSQGIDLTSFSGRIYVGYGTPWTFLNAGYEPPPTVASDPNYYKQYDKMELTYNGNPADVADTTSIDYFSIPIALKVYNNGSSGTLEGSIRAPSTAAVLNAVTNLTTPAGAAIVTNSGGRFVRAIGPSVYPPTGGLPASPYNNFADYLNYLSNTYAPAHNGVVATIEGYFGGVGPSPTTVQTMGQTYDFTVTTDAQKDLILTGIGGQVGSQTLTYKYSDLISPTGIYGANPTFYLNGTAQTPQNDLYGWMTGDLLAGLNIGAVGSTVVRNGVQVGTMESSQWFGLANLFSGLQPNNPDYYDQWAAALSNLSDAYNFPYSDRFAQVTAPLNPANVNSLEIDIGGNANPSNLTWINASRNGVWDASSMNFNSSNGIVAYNDTSNGSNGDNVVFSDNNGGAANYHVSIPALLHPTSVTVNNSTGNYTFSGSGGIAGSGALVKSGTASLTVGTSNSYTGGTNVTGGTLILSTAGALPPNTNLTIAAGASVIANNLGRPIAVSVGTLAVSGTFDLNNNALIVHNSSIGAVTALVAIGYNNGGWNGTTGIINSSAANCSSHLTALGVIQNSADGTPTGTVLYTSFEGEPGSNVDVLVKYTYYGDANLDGKVDGSDYSRIDNGYLSHGSLTGWFNGDFNYDGVINGSDYTLIDNAFNTQGAAVGASIASSPAELSAQVVGTAAAVTVPEPGCLTIFGACSIPLLCQINRRRRLQNSPKRHLDDRPAMISASRLGQVRRIQPVFRTKTTNTPNTIWR
jgi:autotransporter-associated beta strand protein